MKSQQIRQAYLDFFQERGHKIVPSAPLVPPDDPSLLFTTAGMVQFKPLYAGLVQLPYTRAASVQKCLRAGGKGSDLENVGKTVRHHTFFEMLGNFSFGDYFKQDALNWAWEFSTRIIKLDPERIFVSVYEDDDEAWDIWTKQIGLPESRMVRLGARDNFWGPAGDTGACGPCSELYYDRGEKYGAGLTFQHATINDDDPGSRYLEFWNNVFPQFDQQKDGSRPLLKNKGVDTGMSLERLCCLVQETDSLYTTDLMLPIVEEAARLMGVGNYHEATVDIQQAVNVVSDHMRALTFVMSEGILPGNEGRGYVMRRLLRRAARYARKAGMEKPFMENLVEPIIKVMGDSYPEITRSVEHLRKVIRIEENAYLQTLGAGMIRLESLLDTTTGPITQLSGADVFQLTATYGLPLDDVQEIASERGISIDMDSYKQHIAEHQTISRQGGKTSKLADLSQHLKTIREENGPTAFLGYPEESGPQAMEMLQDLIDQGNAGELGDLELEDGEFGGEQLPDNVEDMGSLFKQKEFQNFQKSISDLFGSLGNKGEDENQFSDDDEFEELEDDYPSDQEIFDAMDEDDFFSGTYPVATVSNIMVLGLFENGHPVESASAGSEVAIVLDQTPFYAESGGQIADTGWLTEGNCRIRIFDVQKSPEELFVHLGKVENGTVTNNSILDAGIDLERRMDIMRNHTATHLMQGAMKRTLGTHVTQQGSFVGPDYLRFDFTNPEAVNSETLGEIERLVNEQIMADSALEITWMSLEDARKLPGIIAPFGEKYGQRVRVVDIPQWDTEFCGGTHLLSTGETGPFIIVSESAVSSGVRRIEAVTGRAALELIQSERTAIKRISEDLKVPRDKIGERISTLQDEIRNLKKEIAKAQAAGSSANAGELLDKAETINGVKLIVHLIQNADAKVLRDAYDALKSRQAENLAVLFGGVAGDKASLLAACSKDLVSRGFNAGNLIKQVAPVAGGSGGGKPDMAMAGAKNPDKMQEALDTGCSVAADMLNSLS